MPGFGSKLKHKRLAMGLTLKDAARKAKISQKNLKALEEEEILSFPGKERIAELLTAYAAALGLNQAELLNDFDTLWSDANTAKAYLQQSFNKQHRGGKFTGRKALSYGSVALAAVIFLSLGGFLYWNTFVNQDLHDDQLVSPAEEMGPPEEPVEESLLPQEFIEEEESIEPDGSGLQEEAAADEEQPEQSALQEDPLQPVTGSEDDQPVLIGSDGISTPSTGGGISLNIISMLALFSALCCFFCPVLTRKWGLMKVKEQPFQ